MTTDEEISQIYKKKDRPAILDTEAESYIGSRMKQTDNLWIYENGKIVRRMVTYVPALYRIFDEILINAADNKQRDKNMGTLLVDIDLEKGLIKVLNDGDGVPVIMHNEENVYLPQLLFGQFWTSSNFDDSVNKATGGRYGCGAKLTNLFSKEFTIETVDGKRNKKYKQVFTSNMTGIEEPLIEDWNEPDSWTRVSFEPDFSKFDGMTSLEDDVVALMKKRVIDIAGCFGESVKVYLDGARVQVRSFLDYVKLYLRAASTESKCLPWIEEKNERWEIYASASEGEEFSQVSFVNNVATTKGGSHVDYITEQITRYILPIVKEKHQSANVKAHNVKAHLWVFVNALIDNPDFDSQSKETLTLDQSSFSSNCVISDDFLHKVVKSPIMKNLLFWADSFNGIPKSLGARDAVSVDNRHKCTLILTEGKSAKAIVMTGLSALTESERDTFGVFPLKGKFMNVRKVKKDRALRNNEIRNLINILGLKPNEEYTNTSRQSLRYGQVIIMTDQDVDGLHIKGLLINFFHFYWPSLLKLTPAFITHVNTPIIKATNKDSGTEVHFYTVSELETWKRESPEYSKDRWLIKYYKGLGNSSSKEVKKFFEEIEIYKRAFLWSDEEDSKAIEIAFSENKTEERKKWIDEFDKTDIPVDGNRNINLRYKDFIYKKLTSYSMANVQRSVASMIDGLKPGARKILYCSFKRENLVKEEVNVVEFSGYVAEETSYHHGVKALYGTIIAMAQDFVGSNNLNLLEPSGGQFGTRKTGGKDHASVNYLSIKLSPVTRFIFPQEDDVNLNYLDDEEGKRIEPIWYIPIIPIVLVNGSRGMATGYSSFIPTYNPRDLTYNVRQLMKGGKMKTMKPWYRFKGSIEETATDTISTSNMYLFDEEGKIKKYETPEKILEEFYKIRMKCYQKRLGNLRKKVDEELDKINKKIHFIELALLGKYKLESMTEETLAQCFENLKVASFCREIGVGYITVENLKKLRLESKKLEKEKANLDKSNAQSLWEKDLDALDHQLDMMEGYNNAEAEPGIAALGADGASSSDVDMDVEEMEHEQPASTIKRTERSSDTDMDPETLGAINKSARIGANTDSDD